MHTAATSALAAKCLARSDSKTMAIIGLGAQSEFQALAFRALLGVRSMSVFDVDPVAEAKFVRNLGMLGFSIVRCRDAGEAVDGADIITTATADRRRSMVISDIMVEAGVHINAVGGDCPGKTELPRELVSRADLFVEFAPQTRIEGEIQQMEPDFPVTELWQVIVGDAPGRSGSDRITLFDSVGFAMEDFSALRFLRDKVRGTRHFSTIDLLPAPRDPRDLFGLVGAGETARAALKDSSSPRAA
jgi:ornithine cyclodeaminase